MLDKFKEYKHVKGSKFNGAETQMDNRIRSHKKGINQLRFQQKEFEIDGGVKCHESIQFNEVAGSLVWCIAFLSECYIKGHEEHAITYCLLCIDGPRDIDVSLK